MGILVLDTTIESGLFRMSEPELVVRDPVLIPWIWPWWQSTSQTSQVLLLADLGCWEFIFCQVIDAHSAYTTHRSGDESSFSSERTQWRLPKGRLQAGISSEKLQIFQVLGILLCFQKEFLFLKLLEGRYWNLQIVWYLPLLLECIVGALRICDI